MNGQIEGVLTFLFEPYDQKFFDQNNPEAFWDREKIKLIARKFDKSGGMPVYKYVGAIMYIIQEKLDQVINYIDDEEKVIDFFIGEDFNCFLKFLAHSDFKEFGLVDIEVGWLLKYTSAYLIEAFNTASFEDNRKFILFKRIKYLSRMLMQHWSGYILGYRLSLMWKDLMDEDANLDVIKAEKLIALLFTDKSFSIAKGLIKNNKKRIVKRLDES